VAGQRSTDLLQLAALAQAAEVKDEEAGVLEQCRDLRLGLGVVTGQEDHPLAARLVWVGAEYGGREGVGGLDHTRGGDEIGDDLAGCAPVKVAGVEVVGRVDHYPPVSVQPLDGLRNLRPHHRDDDDVRGCSILDRPGGHPVAKRLDY